MEVFQVLSIILLFLIGYIDIKKMVIPDWCLIFLFLFAALWHPVSIYMGVVCLLVALAARYLVRSKTDSLGYGDIKFIAIAGLFVNIEALPWFFIIMGLGGVVTAVLSRQHKFPFAPSIAAGLLASWYL